MRPLTRVSLFVLWGCGANLPKPPYVAQTTDALVSVEYPPPPARVEFVPKRPSSDAVWIDGEWVWQGRRWAWKLGRWVERPAAARFSPWTMVRGGDGTIFYAGGVWRDEHLRTLSDPPPLAAARPNSGQIDDPEGQAEETGQTVHTSQSTGGAVDADAGTYGGGDSR